MAEFEPITTQEDFDKAVAARLDAERGEIRKEYEGYLSPEDEKKKYKGYLSPEEAAKKDAKIKAYEIEAVKSKVAREAGIPQELAGRLSGENEAELKKDAESLAKILTASGRRGEPPLKSSEASFGSEKDAAYRSMLNELKGE